MNKVDVGALDGPGRHPSRYLRGSATIGGKTTDASRPEHRAFEIRSTRSGRVRKSPLITGARAPIDCRRICHFLFEDRSLDFLHHESNNFSSRPAQGEVAMDQCVYVAQMNIEHFRRRLLTEQDEKTRRQIVQLLAEEEAKLVTLTHASDKNREKNKS